MHLHLSLPKGTPPSSQHCLRTTELTKTLMSCTALQKGVLTTVELANSWSHHAVRPFRGMPIVFYFCLNVLYCWQAVEPRPYCTLVHCSSLHNPSVPSYCSSFGIVICSVVTGNGVTTLGLTDKWLFSADCTYVRTYVRTYVHLRTYVRTHLRTLTYIHMYTPTYVLLG